MNRQRSSKINREANLKLKIEKEKYIVKLMIDIYCKGNKHSRKGNCQKCSELKDYACLRVDKCPFMATKTFCAFCQTHCYEPEMRTKIKRVMRYAGPRMLFRHPILTIKHMSAEYRAKRARVIR